jgi:hypothetical protein
MGASGETVKKSNHIQRPVTTIAIGRVPRPVAPDVIGSQVALQIALIL